MYFASHTRQGLMRSHIIVRHWQHTGEYSHNPAKCCGDLPGSHYLANQRWLNVRPASFNLNSNASLDFLSPDLVAEELQHWPKFNDGEQQVGSIGCKLALTFSMVFSIPTSVNLPAPLCSGIWSFLKSRELFLLLGHITPESSPVRLPLFIVILGRSCTARHKWLAKIRSLTCLE